MPACAFNGCKSYQGRLSRSEGIVFHNFPANNFLKQMWIDVVRQQRREFEWTPTTECRVCSIHFRPKDILMNVNGKIRTVRGAVPYYEFTIDGIEKPLNQITTQATRHMNEANEVIAIETDQCDTQDEMIEKDKTEIAQDKVELEQDNRINNMATTESQTNQPSSNEGNPSDGNAMPLDKFKRRLIRAVARYIQEKKPEEEMWTELKKEIGCDCRMLWQHMRALTMKKLKRLLAANDLLANLKKIARFNATDWLLFDLVLVHEKINVISINDGPNFEDENKEEPQCLHDLFELIKEHNVEYMRGYDLLEAWIRVTLQYNSRGRQCSPMLLQLRWYQMKELTRARFYNFWCEYRGNQKMLDRAMKVKPTALQIAIAKEYKQIITEIYPEWEKLIEDNYVILSEEFTLTRESQRKAKKTREENDIDLEVIEPHVETIELVVDSDEEQETNSQKVCDIENNIKLEDNNKESGLENDENNVNLNSYSNSISNKSDSDGDILELDGLSDVETMHIPLKEEPEDINDYESYDENSTEEVSNDPNFIEILPKITSVSGNIVETAVDEQKLNTFTENNVLYDGGAETKTDINPDIETEDINKLQSNSEDDVDEIIRDKANNLMNIELTEIKSLLEHNNESENIETCEEMPKEDFQTINKVSRSSSESIQSGSDGEIDKLLQVKANSLSTEIPQIKAELLEEAPHLNCDKANNLMNIELTEIKSLLEHNNESENIETCEEMPKEDFQTINKVSRSSSESIQSGSDDEIDKLLQVKANSLSTEIPQIKAELLEEAPHLNLEDVAGNEDANEILNNRDIVEQEDDIAIEEEAIKKEKQDDVFDEVEIDDDDIEFVDDGIEFIEEIIEDKNKTMDLKKEPLSDSEDESNKEDSDDHPKIDLKLLMDPVVYTKKIDKMDVFKLTDYEFVNDKRVIEYALQESKPVDKMALKDEDIAKFREQALRGSETDDTQSDTDIVQTFEENINNRVKCTSWLLQKPKNRSYNPIQLCKNPDFNTRLKRLTPGFLSSSMNRILLKECKPLTIDLHKAFEKKLVNGTMYLKSGDFKSAKVIAVETIENDTVSVFPSLIPGQNMVITTPVVDNNSTMTSTKIDDRCITNERRKIINLPDIDQVRRVNQSLLTAEVTPIRIDSKTINNNANDSDNTINTNNSDNISNASNSENTNSCKEASKLSNVEPLFVQPISVTPIFQVKNEPLESDLNNKNNSLEEANRNQYESNSAKDLMAHKINDQIITLSNQISEVDSNEIINTSIEKPMKKRKIAKKAKNNEKLMEKQKYGQQNKLTYVPLYRDKLTWTPKYPRNYIEDSLLAKDTLVKMLMLLNGNEQVLKKTTSKQKKKLVQLHSQEKRDKKITNTTNDQKVQTENTTNTSEIQSTSSNVITSTLSNTAEDQKVNFSVGRGRPRKRVNKTRNVPETKKYTGIYCCWARERLINVAKNIHLTISTHGCLKFQCQCCCRHELASFTTWKRANSSSGASSSKTSSIITTSNKVSSTIVLSDDDDILNKEIQNKEMVTDAQVKPTDGRDNNSLDNNLCASNSVTENLDNVALDAVIPPLTPIIETTVGTDPSNIGINNIPGRSEVNAEKLASDSNNLPVAEQNVLSKNQKSCKTVVHAAHGHVYNKRTESNNITESSSVTTKLYQSLEVKENATSNHIERTLFLNSNQLNDKPKKSPIYLGKNKILLCSLKNTSVPQMPAPPILPVLPYGVHFMMLPSGELTLSIDDGIQLDPEQLAALPSLMSIVQQQFLKSNISCNIPINIPQTTDTVINTMEGINNTEIVTNSVMDNVSIAINTPAQCIISNTTDEEVISNGTQGETEITNKNHIDTDGHVSLILSNNNDSLTAENINQQAIVNMDVEHEKFDLKTQLIQKQSIDRQLIDTPKNNLQTTESLKSVEQFVEREQEANKISEHKESNSRKTILSDLMEMSGISAEDTISDTTTSCPPVTPLPPNIIPVTRTSGKGNSPSKSKKLENISIAGPYSNLHSFEPNTALNRLMNCVAQLRPELNAVTSFSELRYVYENNGQFFKLDVNTGNISEIKVCIKKNPKAQISAEPKAIIDLTDDTGNDYEEACAEFQDIPKKMGKCYSAPIKPIKLFKSVHPRILHRGNKSILKECEVVYPKKAIHVKKQRRKQLLKWGNRYVLVDAIKGNEPTTSTIPLTSHMDSSFDSSDEEPLAKKSKRFKSTEYVEAENIEYENIEESSALFVDPPGIDPCEAEEVLCVPEFPDMSGDMSDVDMNSMDIEGVNPELHPVAFEEGSESEEDMCILGV